MKSTNGFPVYYYPICLSTTTLGTDYVVTPAKTEALVNAINKFMLSSV